MSVIVSSSTARLVAFAILVTGAVLFAVTGNGGESSLKAAFTGPDPEGGVEMTLCLLGEDQFGNCIPCACCVAGQCGSCDPVLSDGGCPAGTMMPASQCAACNPSSSSSSRFWILWRWYVRPR